MAHTYSDTKPFNRTPLLKQCAESMLAHREREVLSVMLLYCAPDLTMPFRAYNSGTLAEKLKRHPEFVRQALAELQRAKLLSKIKRKRRVYWQLPDEAKIVSYTPRRKR